jgi:mono/diheme cytochrome c family protein
MKIRTITAALAALCAPLGVPMATQAADPAAVARGKYLVTIASCHDCHTPGYFLGKPDMARYLGGSDVGFELPGMGVFVGPNLTPDKETGLGNWTDAQVVAAIQAGARPDGRMLAPIMPYHAFANLTAQDVQAIVAFLRSIPPVQNKVEGPFGPTQAPTVFVMTVVPPPRK